MNSATTTVRHTARASVLELRQYRLVPGRRDTLVDLFDEHLVESQEAVGMHVVGQFRDLDDPDRFVWLRGFDSDDTRTAALADFYGGPTWREHREAANATMVDSDDVLLLEPRHLTGGYPKWGTPRDNDDADSVVAVTVACRTAPLTAADGTIADDVALVFDATGASVVAVLTTHYATNGFPALPVRADHAIVWVTRFADEAALAEHQRRLAAAAAWRDSLVQRLALGATRIQRLRLRPTRRSQLR